MDWIRGLTRIERRVIRDLEALLPDVSQIVRRAVKESRESDDPAFAIVARARSISTQVSAAYRWKPEYDDALAAAGLAALAFGLREGRKRVSNQARRVSQDVQDGQLLLAQSRVQQRSDTQTWAINTAEQAGNRAARAAIIDVVAGTAFAAGAVAATVRGRALVLARNYTADAARDGLFLAYGDVAWVWRAEPDACDICAPLDGTEYPAGDPFDAAHVNCRCFPEPA